MHERDDERAARPSGEKRKAETITKPWTEQRFGVLLAQVPNNPSGDIWPMHRRGLTNDQIVARCDVNPTSVPNYRNDSDAIFDGVPTVGSDVLRKQLLKLDTLRQVERDFLIQTSASTAQRVIPSARGAHARLGAMGQPTENEHDKPEAEPTEIDLKDEEVDAEETEGSDSAERVRTKHGASTPRSAFRWVALAALVAALGSLGISLWMLLRPPSTDKPAEPPAPSTQQITDAKTRACDSYNTVRAAVNLRSNADPGPDPAGLQSEVVSANVRQALAVGNSYLLSHLDAATPAPLAAAIRKFTDESQDVAINALAGVTAEDPAQAARISGFTTLDEQITGLCKSAGTP